MPVYEFRCAMCGIDGQQLRSIDDRDHDPYNPTSQALPRCPQCNVPMVRIYSSFAFKRSMPEHFNRSIGKYVSNSQQFEDGLKRASEEASTPRTVFTAEGESITVTPPEHKFVPVDLHDKQALGVTDEGLDETYRRQTASGQRQSQLWL